MTVYECLLSRDDSERSKAEKALESFKVDALSICRKAIPDELIGFLHEIENNEDDASYYPDLERDKLIVGIYSSLVCRFLFSELK